MNSFFIFPISDLRYSKSIHTLLLKAAWGGTGGMYPLKFRQDVKLNKTRLDNLDLSLNRVIL